MAVPGIFASDAGMPGDRICDHVATCMLATGQSNVAPLYSLMAGMRQDVISSTVVTWTDEFPVCQTSFVTGNCNDPLGNILEVSNPEMIHPKTVLYVACSGELLFVVRVEGCNITVKRGFACTPICPINIDEQLERVGSAFEEGSCPEYGWHSNGTEFSNCTTIIRTTAEITGTAAATKYRSGDKKSMLLRDATMRHAEDKERAIFWHRKYTGQIEGRPWRMMNGIDAQVTQNCYRSPPGGADRLVWDAWLAATFEHNIKGQPNERIMFGDPIAIAAINEMAWACSVKNVPFNLPGQQAKFGITFKEYESIHGTVKIFNHPMFRGKAFGGRIYALHPGAITVHHLEGRNNMYQSEGSHGSSRGQCDSWMATYTSEFTISFCQQSVASKLTHIRPCYART